MSDGTVPKDSDAGLFFCLVEDDPLIAKLAQNLLESAGHRVHVHTSSLEAAKSIPDLKPDVVITDIMCRSWMGWLCVNA